MKALGKDDLLKMNLFRSRAEVASYEVELDGCRIEAMKHEYRDRLRAMVTQLEKDVVARQKAREEYERLCSDLETRYGVDLRTVSYDDETGEFADPTEPTGG